MKREDLIRRLLQTFLQELDEHVRSFERDVLLLEKAADPEEWKELLTSLFRVAHSLKGAARAVEQTTIEAACHELESYFEHALDTLEAVPRHRIQMMLAATDALREEARRLRAGETTRDSPLQRLLPRLRGVSEREEEMIDGGIAGAPHQAEHETRSIPPLDETGPASEVQAAENSLRGEPQRATVSIPSWKLDRVLRRADDLFTARSRTSRSVDRWERLAAELAQCERDGARILATLRSARGAHNDADSPQLRELEALVHSISRARRDADRAAVESGGERDSLSAAVERFAEELRSVRMSPFATACEALDRVARDTAAVAGNQVRVQVGSPDTELDRLVIEEIRSPLIQLVRNAVVHGIESPEERRQAGKEPEGVISVSASLRRGSVEISVSDDGRGIDSLRVKAAAAARGIVTENADAERLILLRGVSTADELTESAGRGVGLDLVQSRVTSLGGTLQVRSERGQGAEFTFHVPLTLGSLRTVTVRAGGQHLLFETAHVERITRFARAEVRIAEGRPFILVDEGSIPIADLARLLGFASGEAEPELRTLLIVGSPARRAGLVVDEVVAEEEVVVKSLGRRISGARLTTAATILSSGEVALILNSAAIVEEIVANAHADAWIESRTEAAPARLRLLVVDDSLTTRTLEKSILEEAGFDVAVAADGKEAWRLLQHLDRDLVITDVEMPEMDGIALTEAIRSSPRLRSLPVILLTSRQSQADRERGMAAGADAYLIKSAFDRSVLLDVIRQLV